MRAALALCALALRASLALPVEAGLSDATLELLKENLGANDADTWVAGAETQALLELDYPLLSVFQPDYLSSLVPSTPIPTSTNNIIAAWNSARPNGAFQLAVVAGGSAGDPASLGVAWVLAALTAGGLVEKLQYMQVMRDEVYYQTHTVPKTSDGAISMRSNTVQLWADFVSQVPPTLAYYGAVMGDKSALLQAYTQCALYRSHLRVPASGLWQHIVMGDYPDAGLWGTGNAWVASGMTRVLATMQNGPAPENYTSQITDLAGWTNEILSAAFAQINTKTNLLPNYYGTSGSFDDASSSALLAATAYRMATLGHPDAAGANLVVADKIRLAVNSAVDSTGWLSPVVDPLLWAQAGYHSPESEAFVIMLQAAWRDYWATR